MSCEPVSDGELAAVVTYLEMYSAPDPVAASAPLSFLRIERPDHETYRQLFRLVGSRWLWFSRLTLDDEALTAIIQDPQVELYRVIDGNGADAGMLELDFREAGQCELAFIGLVPELAGKGYGRWLLAEGLRGAWRDGVHRVHVHTCSLDHPAALNAYRRAGFIPYKRAIERFPDPRTLGILPADCAPQIPLLGTLTSASPRAS